MSGVKTVTGKNTVLLMVISSLLTVLTTVAIGFGVSLDKKKLDVNVFEVHKETWKESIRELKAGQEKLAEKIDDLTKALIKDK